MKKITPKPIVNLPVADSISLTEDKKERLSEIIEDINAKTGSDFDISQATAAALQVRDIMLKSEELRMSAKNNTQSDFGFSYFSNVEDALVQGYEKNKGFFGYLLENADVQKEVMGMFLNEIYNSLRADAK